MAGPQRIEWRRGFPFGAMARLFWYLVTAALLVGAVWGMFYDEPSWLSTGERNPLVFVVPAAFVLAILGSLPFVLRVLRRPIAAANHYALTVRPGSWRVLMLPWARLAVVAAYKVGGEAYLFIRFRDVRERAGDRPRRFDQKVLRAARRRGEVPNIDRYHLALRMRDFVGSPRSLLATLAAYAPDHVLITSDLFRDR